MKRNAYFCPFVIISSSFLSLIHPTVPSMASVLIRKRENCRTTIRIDPSHVKIWYLGWRLICNDGENNMLICCLSITKRKDTIVGRVSGNREFNEKWRQRMKNDDIEVKFKVGLILRRLYRKRWNTSSFGESTSELLNVIFWGFGPRSCSHTEKTEQGWSSCWQKAYL